MKGRDWKTLDVYYRKDKSEIALASKMCHNLLLCKLAKIEAELKFNVDIRNRFFKFWINSFFNLFHTSVYIYLLSVQPSDKYGTRPF